MSRRDLVSSHLRARSRSPRRASPRSPRPLLVQCSMVLYSPAQRFRNDHYPVGLHRAGLCHGDDGCDCDCCRTRRHQHDRCCDLSYCCCDRCCCDLRDHCCCGCCYGDCCCARHDRCYCDCYLGSARLHDVLLAQLVCLRVRLIQFPNRQVPRHRRQVLDWQMLPACQPLVLRPFLQALARLLSALSARGSSR